MEIGVPDMLMGEYYSDKNKNVGFEMGMGLEYTEGNTTIKNTSSIIIGNNK